MELFNDFWELFWPKGLLEGLAFGTGFCLLILILGYLASSKEERIEGKSQILITLVVFLGLIAGRLLV